MGTAASSPPPRPPSEGEVPEMPPTSSSSSPSSGDDWYDPAQVRKGGPSNVKVPDIDVLLDRDGYLRDHEREIRQVITSHCFFWAIVLKEALGKRPP